MEIDPSLQLAMLLSALLWGVGMGILWELLTAIRILLGAYTPPEAMRAQYAKRLPLLGRPVTFERKSPLRRVWRGVVIALGDVLFCVVIAIVAILILYRYNDGVFRLSVPVLMLLGLALLRFISATPLARVMAYVAYGFAAAGVYATALLSLPWKGIKLFWRRLCLRLMGAVYRKLTLRHLRRVSAALCAYQLAYAAVGLEGEGPGPIERKEKKKGRMHYGKKQNRGQDNTHTMGDSHPGSDHFRGGHRHRDPQFHGDQSI